jgi:hypothetical protein
VFECCICYRLKKEMSDSGIFDLLMVYDLRLESVHVCFDFWLMNVDDVLEKLGDKKVLICFFLPGR